ncbi:MAG: eL32 family ribosomal protein [Candidatus Nanoarchaeia archaeon]|nr:eL32 family ribosomal protein [Candidatus Nanoarchaeia archaeon]MDD5053999.1 eL32 family ribosomal protein [Candidatus Nanoarchaeia archaeon]
MSNDLLKIKNEMKKRKPAFRRVEKHRHPALPDNWRKPKGHHSKIRRKKKWEMRMPSIGIKTPKKLQNKDKQGRDIIIIRIAKDLEKLSEKTVGVIASGLGLKKKSLIAQKAIGKKHKFLNFNPERIIKKIESMKDSKKEIKKPEEKTIKLKEEKPIKPIKAEKPVKEKPIKAEKPIKEKPAKKESITNEKEGEAKK